MEERQATDSLSTEERLFSALFNRSPLSECEGLLGEVEDVDARGVRGRTALHVAVRAGYDDWVERLLGMGADPRLRDAEGDDVLQVAEVMSASSTDDTNLSARMKILMLVRVVHQHNSARRLSVPMAPCSCNTSSEVPSLQTEMSTQITALKELILGVSREIGSLKETVLELKRELEARDTLLIALESGVTSLVDKSASLEGGARESLAGAAEVVTEGERDCVEAMMGITTILHANDEKESCVRRIYQRVQSESPLTAAIVRFIVKQSGVSVHIDCSSDTIERMKGRVINYNGEERDGLIFNSFADFSEMRVYLGGGKIRESERGEKVVATRLVCSLCKLAVSIAFKNGGRPYAENDTLNRRRFEEVLRQAEEVRKRMENVYFFVKEALGNKTLRAKEIYLISIIPQMLVFFGSNSPEISEVRRTLPLLFEYLEGHVMATLESTMPSLPSRS
ncbi:uncharacterized protein [Hetaerina americana]|uniref:uncharacterized protein n=1 Tax=Hetaerina americana TaxID=62018 RepID=UPI003A7F4854